MKRSLIIGVAFVACMVVLRTGLAQAQSPSAPPTQSVAKVEVPAKDPSTGMIGPKFVDPNQLLAGECFVGPQNGDVIVRCFGFGFFFSPSEVFCQPRNSRSQLIFFPDAFSCQILGTTPQDNGSVFFRIHRLDIPGAGWGQNLLADILIVQ